MYALCFSRLGESNLVSVTIQPLAPVTFHPVSAAKWDLRLLSLLLLVTPTHYHLSEWPSFLNIALANLGHLAHLWAVRF